MGFRKSRGIKLSEEWQGLIRFTCLTYGDQPPEVKHKIQKLCHKAGGEYHKALFEVMCTKRSVTAISAKFCVSEPTLYRARRKFFEMWRSM